MTTRRRILGAAVCGLSLGRGCGAPGPGERAKLASVAESGSLAVIPMLWTNGLVPEALAVDGKQAGELVFPEKPWLVSISPDCGWVAWYPESSLPSPFGSGHSTVHIMGAGAPQRSVQLGTNYVRQIALCSGAERLAVLVNPDGLGTWQLLTLNVASGRVEQDLTPLTKNLQLADADRLRASGRGNRLLIGQGEFFVVIDTSLGKVVLEGHGRFPCLSADGDLVACVSSDGELVFLSVTPSNVRATGRRVRVGTSVLGLGAWSSGAEFLLAGLRGPFSFFVRLAAIDRETGASVDLDPRLPEGSLGEQSAWISRRLLAK